MGQSATLIPSIVRTVVPIGVGALLGWLITLGVEFDPGTEQQIITAVTVFVTAVVQALYYMVARWLEQKFPSAGALLGLPKTPDSYSKDVIPGEVVETEDKEDLQPYGLESTPPGQQRHLDGYMRLNGHLEDDPAERDLTPPPAGYRPRHALRGDSDVPAFPTQEDLDRTDKERGL